MQKKATNKFYIWFITIFILIIYLISGFHSYGTGDVKLWLSWAKEFVNSGFWDNFLKLSDIPLFSSTMVYLAGLSSKGLLGSVTESTFPGMLKAIMLPFLFGSTLIARKITRDNLVVFLILLNPAIFLNLAILGYLDVFFIFGLFLLLYLLYKVVIVKKTNKWIPFIYSSVLILGLLSKPQWIMFFPIFTIFGFMFFYKRYLKQYMIGYAAGICVILLIIFFGAKSLPEIATRIYAVKITYTRTVGGQIFVVANFPNFWHGINFFVHTCRGSCSITDLWNGLFRPLKFWQDREITIRGRSLFITAIFIYGFLISRKIVKKRLLNNKNIISTIVISSIWMNLVYAFFNTSVHENHLIATVFLSAFLYALKRTRSIFMIYLFLTMFNFLNLSYYYGFGISGIYGLYFNYPVTGLNISLVLLISYLVYLILASYRLLTNKGSSLGLG